MITFSTSLIETLADFKQTSDIDSVELLCAGVKSLRIGLCVSRTAPWSDILGATVTLLGSNDGASGPEFYLPPEKCLLAAPTGVSVASKTSTISFHDSAALVQVGVWITDPPPVVRLTFAATTFPSSPGSAFFSASASWSP